MWAIVLSLVKAGLMLDGVMILACDYTGSGLVVS